jgi:hypothetical protein
MLGCLIHFHPVLRSFHDSAMMLLVIEPKMKAEAVRFASGREKALSGPRVWNRSPSSLAVMVETSTMVRHLVYFVYWFDLR